MMPELECNEFSVLIYDKDAEWGESLLTLLKRQEIRSILMSNDFSELISKAENSLSHVAIINVHCLDNPKEDLADLISRVSDITIIIIGDYVDPIMNTFLLPPDVVAHYNLGSKTQFVVKDMVSHCSEILKLWEMKVGGIEINFPDNIEESFRSFSRSWSGNTRRDFKLSSNAMRYELEIIIGKLFAGYDEDQKITKQVDVEYFGGAGKSASFLFKVTPKVILDETHRKSAVLKFGPKDELLRESSNYDKYVEWFLTVSQTVRKIGYQEGNYFSGLLYSYPLDNDSGYIPLAAYVRDKKTDESIAVFRNIFSTENQHWLSVDGNSFKNQTPDDFQSYYIEHALHTDLHELVTVHYEKYKEEMKNLEFSKQNHFWREKTETISFPPLNIGIRNPMAYVSKPYVDQIKLSIIHGDLHAHNILVNDNKNYFMIDFFYTGFGHIYKDFIDLEISIRYDLFSSSTLADDERLTCENSQDTNIPGLRKLYLLEKALIDSHVNDKPLMNQAIINDENLKKGFDLISEIRKLALDNYPSGIREYYLALAFYSLKALKYFYPLDVKTHRIILSGLCFEVLGCENMIKKSKR